MFFIVISQTEMVLTAIKVLEDPCGIRPSEVTKMPDFISTFDAEVMSSNNLIIHFLHRPKRTIAELNYILMIIVFITGEPYLWVHKSDLTY